MSYFIIICACGMSYEAKAIESEAFGIPDETGGYFRSEKINWF